MTERGDDGERTQTASRRDCAADRLCAAIDDLNEWMGRFWGAAILVVTIAVIWEVVSRTFFAQATTWANETTIYLSAMAYLLGGGYALKHRRHVRIDVVYQMFSEPARRRLDVLAFVFFVLYVGALVWVGADMAWTSFQQSEGTGTPWNPRIWPVKLAIPCAALLLLLQGIADLVRELGIAGASARP